jgi:two-component system, NtrC family, response regulator AtoC
MSHAVLIIEDEASLAKNMKRYLDRHGFVVRAVTSAEDGLAQLDQYKPDAILLDFHLPGMNGIQAIAKIRALDSRIKMIMITGHSSVQLAVDAMKAGAHEFLRKPVALSEIKRRLETALG